MNGYLGYFIWLLSSKGVRAVISLIFIALLARVLGPNGLGEWAMIVAAGTLLHSLLLNWMHAPTVRFGREEWQKQGTIATTWSARIPYLLVGFVIAIGLVAFNPVQWLERYFHISGNFKLAALLAVFWLWLSVEAQNLLQLRHAVLRLSISPVFIDAMPVFILVIILISGWSALSEHTLIQGLLILNVFLWGAFLCWELMKLNVRWVRPNIKALCKTFYYSWPLIPGFLVGYVSDWGDQLLVRYFFNSHEVGLFQAAYQFMVLMLGIVAPLSVIIMPKLVDKETLSLDVVKDFLNTAGPTMIVLGLFMLIPVVSFAPFFFQILMGGKFVEANTVFIVLCAAIPGSILSVFYGIFFNLQGRLWRSTVIYGGIVSALNVLVSLILLPRLGILGAAIATSISYLVAQFLYLLDQNRYYHISSTKGYILFSVILTFAIAQIMVGGGLLARFLLCLLYIAALVMASRVYSLLDRAWVMRIFSGKLSKTGEIILRFTKS